MVQLLSSLLSPARSTAQIIPTSPNRASGSNMSGREIAAQPSPLNLEDMLESTFGSDDRDQGGGIDIELDAFRTNQLTEWLQDADYGVEVHQQLAADFNMKFFKYCALPNMFFSTLAGLIALLPSEFWDSPWKGVLVACLSTITGFTSGVANYWRWHGLSERHLYASKEYNILKQQLEVIIVKRASEPDQKKRAGIFNEGFCDISKKLGEIKKEVGPVGSSFGGKVWRDYNVRFLAKLRTTTSAKREEMQLRQEMANTDFGKVSASAAQELEKLREKKARLQTAIKTDEGRHDTLKNRIEDIERQKNEAEESLKNKIADIEREKKKAEESRQELKSAIDSLNREKHMMEKENTKLQKGKNNMVHHLQAQSKIGREVRDALEHEKGKWKDRFRRLRNGENVTDSEEEEENFAASNVIGLFDDHPPMDPPSTPPPPPPPPISEP